MDLDVCLPILLGGCKDPVQGAEEGSAARYAQTGMLTFAYEGLECLEFYVLGAEGIFDGLSDGMNLLGGQLHGPMETVKHPAQNFLGGIPDAFPIND